MSPSLSAHSAYASPAQPTRTARGTEYDLIARITARLRAAGSSGAFADLVRALHDNRMLWATFAADVAEPGNGLPEPLKARIFWLAEYTDRHSDRVLAGEAGADALVEINTAVMRGLRGDAGDTTAGGRA